MPKSAPKESPPAPQPADAVRVRLLRPTDSFVEITGVLHRAYAGQVAMGLRPLAGRQDAATTKKRCSSGECFLAVTGDGSNGRERIVGIILFHEVEDAQGPEWFRRRDVDYFSQFAVDPDIQGRGIGRLLLDTVERRAKECGAVEISCSMAEPDAKLMEYYLRRGYRLIEHWQWPYTNYRSAILSKPIG